MHVQRTRTYTNNECVCKYVLYACTVYMYHAYVVKGLDKGYGWTFV